MSKIPGVLMAACLVPAGGYAQAVPSVRLGPAPGRAFVISQLGQWRSTGLPVGISTATETTITIAPDTGWSLTRRSFRVHVEPNALDRTAFALGSLDLPHARHGAVVQLRDAPLPPVLGEDRKGPTPIPGLALAGPWLSVIPLRGEVWQDTMKGVVQGWGDSLVYRLVRSGRLLRATRLGNGRWDRLRDSGTLTFQVSHLIEEEMGKGGVRVRTTLTGPVEENLWYDEQAHLADSVNLNAILSGEIVFREITGRLDTVAGVWTIRVSASWQSDPAAEWGRRLQYFTAHGRDSSESGDSTLLGSMVDRALEGDTIAVDSLLRLRESVDDPFRRREVELAIHPVFQDSIAGPRFIRYLLSRYRPGDWSMLRELLGLLQYGEGTRRVSAPIAAVLARELQSIRTQRTTQFDRFDLFPSILEVFQNDTIDPMAGPVFAAAAERADDPLSRDLLLLGAYRADPRRYLPTVMRLADSTFGYGPIVRRYADGDGSLLGWSWGTEAGLDTAGKVFPGPTAPVESLAAYLDGPNFGVREQVLREWFVARGVDGRAAFRQRFATEVNSRARLTMAGYLRLLGDTSAAPWLRSIWASDTSEIGREAGSVLAMSVAPDTVRDEALLTELQDAALTYVTSGGGLKDTADHALEPFWAHDERPDQKLLLDQGVTAEVKRLWGSRFQIVSRDSLKSRVRREGLQMALEFSPLTRRGRHFFFQVALQPWTRPRQMCLCGGGSWFVLERRNGRWVVISNSRWVS